MLNSIALVIPDDVTVDVGTNHAPDHPAEKSQRGGSSMRAKASGAAVARADQRGTVPLRTAEEPGSEIFSATRASDRSAAQRGVAKGTPRPAQYGRGRTRAVPALPQVLAQNGLLEIASLPRGERIMLERKKLEGFYRELQTPSRIEANTPTPQVKQREEDLNSELTKS